MNLSMIPASYPVLYLALGRGTGKLWIGLLSIGLADTPI